MPIPFLSDLPIPVWGNYGGPNCPPGNPWTYNKQRNEYEYDKDHTLPETTDGLDEIFKAHDSAYGRTELELERGEITAIEAVAAKLRADLQLIRDMNSYRPEDDQRLQLNNRNDVDAAGEAIAGVTFAFAVKLSWDIIVSSASAAEFDSAQSYVPRRADPLVLDLDGDGIETLARVKPLSPYTGTIVNPSSTQSIMFDYNGDGIRTNIGWVSADDGFLVLDRNNNGTIDNGSELFGDQTLLNSGAKAADGFACLKDQDTNHDGIVNNLDANWSNLKVWQDLNQDGISQIGELSTLDQLGITSLNVAKTNTSQALANGNSIKGTGTFTKADGTTGNMADVNLAIDTAMQEFATPVTVLPEVAVLPEMSGSGFVRDLHQAASLSPTLQIILTQYSQATTRQAQLAIIDQLLYSWADTSGLAQRWKRLIGLPRQQNHSGGQHENVKQKKDR